MDQAKEVLSVTPSAAMKAVTLRDREVAGAALALRCGVQPGGCSGLRYSLYFDDRQLDGDTAWEVAVDDREPLAVVVDRMSLPYLQGATIDFVDSIDKQGFTIDNPNALGGCACGDSFH
jgi:iron-sulfur cluster assembly accessory protein